MKIYKFYGDTNIKEFWIHYWNHIKEDKDYIRDYNYYPFIPLKQYLKKTDRILEIGCGTGRVLKGLFNEGYNISGFDFDYNCLRSVNLRREYPVFLADIRNMPIRNNSVDAVLCFGVITGIEDFLIEGILKDIRKVLKPDGIFIVSLLNYNVLRKIQRYLLWLRMLLRLEKFFYCWAASISDLTAFLEKYFIVVDRIPGKSRDSLWHYAPFLRGGKNIDETIARVDDKHYILNFFGEGLFRLFNFLCPYAVCGSTIFVCKNSK